MERKASTQQKRLFFALCNQLDLDSELAKERAKRKFKREHFADLSVEEMAILLDSLQQRVDATMIKCPTCRGTGYIKKESLEVQEELYD